MRVLTINSCSHINRFRWVELQLDLFISQERPVKYWKDFDARLRKLEEAQRSGQEIIDRLSTAYDEIFERNTQGIHSLRIAVKTLQWVLCAFRPLDIGELREAIAVEEQDVPSKLLLSLCSNFIHLDAKGYVRLAHVSVKEYLELKRIEGRFRFSYSEAHARAAMTCISYWSFPYKERRQPIVSKRHQLHLSEDSHRFVTVENAGIPGNVSSE